MRKLVTAALVVGGCALGFAQVIHVVSHRPYNDPYAGYFPRGRKLTFFGKVTGIQVVKQLSGEDSDVTCPAESLIPLRAVGGEIEEITPEAPDDVLVQLVEHFVGALELAYAL